ncbi:M14 family metallopeptidase [Kaarinaea lacus]
MLNIIDHIPEGLMDCAAEDLHQLLPGPTLIHLQGRHQEPLFVSVLLHGNEPTGLKAIQALLKKTAGKTLPRALSIFIGNVSAAKEGRRHLDGQPDYNRIWPCGANSETIDFTPEHAMMHKIVDIMKEKNIFASIDVHNNTGLNPHYGCINRLETAFFHLATQFSRTVVYFIRPHGVQSMAFAEICPAVTVECGKPDQDYGAAHAMEFIESCLHMSSIPEHPIAPHDIDLFHTVATV